MLALYLGHVREANVLINRFNLDESEIESIYRYQELNYLKEDVLLAIERLESDEEISYPVGEYIVEHDDVITVIACRFLDKVSNEYDRDLLMEDIIHDVIEEKNIEALVEKEEE